MATCYLCQSQEARSIGLSFFKCLKCGVVYQYPQPDDHCIKGFYSPDYYSTGIPRKEDIINCKYRENLRLIDNYFPQKGRLLDVGCGTGFFMELAHQSSNWEVFGLDLSDWAVNYARQELGIKNISAGTLLEVKLEDNFFDVVVMTELIEHDKSPILLLKEAFRLLKDGGLLLITTPNIGGIKAKLSGQGWWQLAKEHLFLFNQVSLIRLLEGAGFRIVKVTTRPYLKRYLDYAVSKNPFLQMRYYGRKAGFWTIDRLKLGELLVICGCKGSQQIK